MIAKQTPPESRFGSLTNGIVRKPESDATASADMNLVRAGLSKFSRPRQKRTPKVSRAVLPLIVALCFAASGWSATSPTEREVVAAVIMLEAGGEPAVGMESVMEVIQTRAKERHQTPLRVVTAKSQFSCMNNRSVEDAVKKAIQHPRWKPAFKMAAGVKTNHTKNANHYFVTGTPTPAWAEGKHPVAVVGHHSFYRL